MTKKTDDIERRADMKLMAQRVAQIHLAIYGEEGKDEDGWICRKLNKNEKDIHEIKTVWACIYAGVLLVGGWLIRKL